MYRGTGAGGFVPNSGEAIGSGWGSFTALLATEFSGDGKQDLLARNTDGLLLMYRGNGRGGFVTGTGESLGGGWGGFTALVAPGDFSGDRFRDLIAGDVVGAYAGREAFPGREVRADEHVQADARGFFHPVGTCVLGRVVDGDGRVLGLDGLCVADASIVPTIPRVNSNHSTLALAERLSERIAV